MKSKKLTRSMRDKIRESVLSYRFGSDMNELIKDRAAFACKVYDDFYKGKNLKILQSIPDGWLPKASSIRAQFGGKYESLYFSGRIYGYMDYIGNHVDAIWKPFSDTHAGRASKVYDVKSPFSIEESKLSARLVDLREDIGNASNQILAVLREVNTTKQLIDIWPEMEPFCAPYQESSIQLPSIPVEHLNTIFKLPVKDLSV